MARHELTIESLGSGGEGVGRVAGRTVFVPFTAPGDRVRIELPDGDGVAHVEQAELVAGGPARHPASCPHFGPEGDRCGGCEWLHVDEAVQLAAKAAALRETLRKIGRLDPDACGWRPPIPSPSPLRYRSRAKFHFDRRGGRLIFFRRRSHDPVALADCQLLTPGLEALRRAFGPALAASGLAPGQVALEWSDFEGRGAAQLMLPGPPGKEQRARAERLLAEVGALSGLVLTAEGAAPLLLGEPVLRHQRIPGDPAGGLAPSRPDVFAQANRAANALLVREALDLLEPDGQPVLELYCGAGNFTGPLAARASSVAAVELQGPALELARNEPPAGQVRYFAGEALPLALAFARERSGQRPSFTRLLLDPPRDGAKGIGAALRALEMQRAVYVSCDPATVARDLRGCAAVGYRIEALRAVDMFPQTHHLETVALLVSGTPP